MVPVIRFVIGIEKSVRSPFNWNSPEVFTCAATISFFAER
jgi:hypothetical protein